MSRELDSEKILKMMETGNNLPITVYHGDVQTQRRQLKSLGVMHGHVRHGFLKKVRNTPHTLMNMSWRGLPWECLVEDRDFMALYTHDSNPNAEEPSGVWPVFRAKEQDLEDLIGYCKYPWGEREDLFGKNNWGTGDLHPRPGQPHVVWVTGFLSTPSHAEYDKWMGILEELTAEYGVQFGLTGSVSFRAAFGGAFRYAAMSLKQDTGGGRVFLPNGRRINRARREEQVPMVASVIRAMGFDPDLVATDMDQIRLFNIASIQRAALTWKKDGSAKSIRTKDFVVDSKSPRAVATASNLKTKAPPKMKQKAESTDMVLCESCSLWSFCPQYRDGEVCSVGGSDGRRLAEMFGTRDPAKIIDALAEINGKMTERAIDALENEVPTEDKALDPTVTTALNQVFANGVKLAKLIDPSLNGGVQVNVGVQAGGRAAVHAAASRVQSGQANERELAATVIAELESEGYSRSQITEDMVRSKMREYATRSRGALEAAQEAEVVEDV